MITTSENFFNEINGVKDIKRGIIVRTGTLNRGITNVIQTVFGHDINPNGDYFIMVRLTYKTANSDKWRGDGRVFNAQPVASPAFANHYSFAELSNYRYIT